ncbi:MAG: IclR family transcriptional regulator C-terminal domain-containing protein [Sphingomonas sp.]
MSAAPCPASAPRWAGCCSPRSSKARWPTTSTKAPLPPRTPHTIVDRAALKAELGRVRRQGWCLVDQELELGLRSIAVPVRNRRGRTVAALNVGAQVRSLGVEKLLRVALPELQAAAVHLSRVA